jgi:DNA-directed RNA polymerase subunit L/phenylpyruvate tautomerase PptA (4-oxalocrotonate tautomerase family)
MEPRISNLREENGFLKFTLLDCNMSIANALRRIIVSDIPTFVFRTYPYSENKAEIIHNTTRFHNEIIKQRLSCIPIHIDDMDFPYKDYVVEVDVKNDTDSILYVTTKDFKIKNSKTEVYSDESAVRAIFPPSSVTGDYIEFARLQPKLSENIDGERLTLRCGLDIGMASQDGAFNVISTCAYECTPDVAKANEVWGEKEAAMKKSNMKEIEIEFEKKNWFLLEAKRYYQPNSYDFIIESVGVFDNSEIVIKACKIMISKCEKFLYDLEHGKVSIVPSETTLKNGFDVTLVNEDYTLGKVIEFYLYQQNFIADKTLSFCGFRKPHPHATDSIIRVAFHNEIDPVGVSGYIQGATDNAIAAFKKLVEQMGGDLKKTERVRLATGLSMSKSSSRNASPRKTSGAAVAEESVADVPQPEPGAAAAPSKSKKSKVSSIKVDLSKVTLPSALSSSKKEPKGDEPEPEEEEE